VRVPVAGTGCVLGGARRDERLPVEGLRLFDDVVRHVEERVRESVPDDGDPHGRPEDDERDDEGPAPELGVVGVHASTHARTARTWSRMAESVVRVLTVSVAESMPSGSWLSVRRT